DFIDTGQAQFYFLNFPVVSPNGDSGIAALAAEAVYHQNPNDFWKFYEALFATQQDEPDTWNSEILVQIAKEANVELDYEQFKTEIEQATFADVVREDLAIGDKAGVDGTPTIFINGKELPIQQVFNYEAFKQAIVEELEKAS